ncbi:hypothetical protein MHA_2559 [Mannheimia haemolytica PHL213]|nr:hypothetical protein MHA_2559 [Mannheimia haemolytica PHL213]
MFLLNNLQTTNEYPHNYGVGAKNLSPLSVIR